MTFKQEYISLSDLILLQRGFDLPSEKRIQGKIPVVASTGIVGYHKEAKVSSPGVVIGRSGSIGGGQYITEDFWPLNTTLWVKDFRGHNKRFIYYLLKSIDFQRFNAGSGVPTLNRNHLETISVIKLNKYEEDFIASSLGVLDDKIELLRCQNETLERLSQTLFQRWFVEFEFPDEAGKPYRSAGGKMIPSPLGAIPERWRISKVKEEIEILGGGTPSTTESFYWENGNINWYTPTDLTSSNMLFSIESEKKISEEGLRNSAAKLFPKYSLLMTSRATIGEVAINIEKACTNQGFIVLVPNERYPIYFLHGWLLKEIKLVKRLASGSTFPEMSRSEFKNFDIMKIPRKIMKNFTSITEPIYKKIESNTKESRSLTLIRDGLLPRLMSGQIRVKE